MASSVVYSPIMFVNCCGMFVWVVAQENVHQADDGSVIRFKEVRHKSGSFVGLAAACSTLGVYSIAAVVVFCCRHVCRRHLSTSSLAKGFVTPKRCAQGPPATGRMVARKFRRVDLSLHIGEVFGPSMPRLSCDDIVYAATNAGVG